jgi:uncharacterized protein YeaO (DUF488 family)
MIQVKRAYEPVLASDGYRVLVDRLWPRGLRKEDARLDEWLKELAPSDALRKWFGHDPSRFQGFRERYARELHENPAAGELLDALATRAARETVTLVYSAHDEEHNNAVVLAEEIARRSAHRPRARRAAAGHATHARR